MGKILVSAAALLCWAAAAPPAAPQEAVSISVARITTKQTCNYFQESAGRSALVATPWMIAAASAWRSWWVKDCVAQFATMRSTLEAALASSGKLRVGGGGGYSVFLNITDVAGGDAPAPDAPDGKEYAVARSYMVVSMDVSVRDRAGRSVFGGLLTKKLETGYDVKVDGFEARGNESGQAAYGRMQNELALAAARLVAFHFAPIEVTGADGREVQLNYGAPLLKLGSLVSISSPDRRATMLYRVISAANGFATAELDGGGDYSRIVPGSTGTFVEADDPAANARRYKKVDLP